MKEIINYKEKTVDIDDISNTSYVGIVWNDDTKAFVMKDPRKGYSARSVGRILEESHPWTESSVKSYVKRAMSSVGVKAFLFDSCNELFMWLAQ